MDAYINISVSMPDAEPFTYRLKVKNVYGVMTRADDPRKKFIGILSGALARSFGQNAVTVEALKAVKDPVEEAPLKRGPGRPRREVP